MYTQASCFFSLKKKDLLQYLLSMLIILFLTLGGIVLSWIVLDSIKTGITPMPSTRKSLEAISELIPEAFEGKIVDLGSGWGSMASYLAKKFPKSKVMGYEISYLPYLVSRLRSQTNLHFYHEDFFKLDLRQYQIVVCYLYPAAMERLKPKLEKELDAGVLVISSTFAIPGWKPVKTVELADLYRTKVYLYQG